MSREDDLRAELALIAMEEDFVAAKESGDVTREQRDALREARREFRQRREGAAVAAPEAIEVKTAVVDLDGDAA